MRRYVLAGFLLILLSACNIQREANKRPDEQPALLVSSLNPTPELSASPTIAATATTIALVSSPTAIINPAQAAAQQSTHTPTPTLSQQSQSSPPIVNSAPAAALAISTPQVVYFRADRAEVSRGETVTLSWEVAGAENVEILAEGSDYRAKDLVGRDLPPQGSVNYLIPEQNAYFTVAITFILAGYGRDNHSNGSQFSVPILCPFTPMGDTCPLTNQVIAMTYQPFERGFMLRRGDTGEVMVFSSSGSILHPEFEETPPVDQSPAGLFPADTAFNSAWNSHDTDRAAPLIRDTLGWATAPAMNYTATLQTTPNIRDKNERYLTLPDGSAIEIQAYFSRPVGWRRR